MSDQSKSGGELRQGPDSIGFQYGSEGGKGTGLYGEIVLGDDGLFDIDAISGGAFLGKFGGGTQVDLENFEYQSNFNYGLVQGHLDTSSGEGGIGAGVLVASGYTEVNWGESLEAGVRILGQNYAYLRGSDATGEGESSVEIPGENEQLADRERGYNQRVGDYQLEASIHPQQAYNDLKQYVSDFGDMLVEDDGVHSHEMFGHAVGVSDTFQRGSELIDAYGDHVPEEVLREDAKDEVWSTSPAENWGSKNDGLDGAGTDWPESDLAGRSDQSTIWAGYEGEGGVSSNQVHAQRSGIDLQSESNQPIYSDVWNDLDDGDRSNAHSVQASANTADDRDDGPVGLSSDTGSTYTTHFEDQGDGSDSQFADRSSGQQGNDAPAIRGADNATVSVKDARLGPHRGEQSTDFGNSLSGGTNGSLSDEDIGYRLSAGGALYAASQQGDGAALVTNALGLLSHSDGGSGTGVDQMAGLAALTRSDSDIGMVSGGLDLLSGLDDGNNTSLDTAAGVVGGLAALSSMDTALDDGDYDALIRSGAMLAQAMGEEVLAETLGEVAGYVGIAMALAEGDSTEAAVQAVSMAVPYVGVLYAMAEGDSSAAFMATLTLINPYLAMAVVAIEYLTMEEPPPPPEAEATVKVNDQGDYYVDSATDAHGGNAGSMFVAAEQAAQVLNGLVDATGGRLLDPDAVGSFQVGYEGSPPEIRVNGHKVANIQEAVARLVQDALADTPIEGGDLYVKRALYRQLEDGDIDIAEVFENLEAAGAYSDDRRNAVILERLAEDEAVAEELARYDAGELTRDELGDGALQLLEARENAAAVADLHLDDAHRFDQVSRLNERFAEQGIDLAGVEVTDLALSHWFGDLIVGIKDESGAIDPIRTLPHASVAAHVDDFGAAMLYLPASDNGGGAWNLADLVALTGVEAGGGVVDVRQALIDHYTADGEILRMGTAVDDVIEGGEADEALIGWQGSDILRGAGGDDTLVGGGGADTLLGGAGEDTADYSASAQGVAVDLDTGEGRGGDAVGDRLEDIEHLEGSLHDDHLAGDEQANKLTGNAGDDVLNGRGGDDILHGGAGEDRLDGGTGDDTLAGHAGHDFLDGGAGDDRLSGGQGNDDLAGGAGDDLVMGGSGDDRLLGGQGNDRLAAGAGDDVLGGGAGRDTLSGGAGNDILLATGDGDTLHGGVGADTVVYEHDMADYRVELVDGELRIARPDGEGASDRLIDIETVRFGDRVVSVETLKEYLSILDTADEEERQRRISGVAASGATAIGDAAAIGLLAGFVEPAIAAEQRLNEYRNRFDATAPAGAADEFPPGAAAEALLSDLVTEPGGDPAGLGDGAGAGGGGGDGDGSGDRASRSPDAGAPTVSTPIEAERSGGEAAIVAHESDPGDDAGEAQAHGDADPEENSGDDSGDDAGADRIVDFDDEDDDFPVYLRGTPGDDVLIDDLGYDRIVGLSGDDLIVARDGDDLIEAGDGNDVILPGAGVDEVFGGAGIDTVSYRDAASSIELDLGAQQGIAGMAAGDLYHDIEQAEGSHFDDRMYASDSSTTALYGLDGDDELIGGETADRLYGGAGDDTLAGHAGADLLQGGAGADTLTGGEGDDDLDGGAGNDLLRGSLGADLLLGGAGDDELDGGDDDDVLYGDAGSDVLAGDLGDDTLFGGDDADTLSGGDGMDTLFGEAGDDVLEGGAGRDQLDGGSGDDILHGDGGEDRLLGGAGNDSLAGGAGDDELAGGDGADTLEGGDGADILHGEAGADTLLGGDGNDTLSGGAGTDTLAGDAGADTLYGGTGDDVLSGGADADTLYGESGDDELDGGEGDDTLEGGAGSDRLIGGAGADTYIAGAGDDTLVVDAEDDLAFIDGGSGHDTVELAGDHAGAVDLTAIDTGTAGADDGIEAVHGSANDDVMTGHYGLDAIEGGEGHDIVTFDEDVLDVGLEWIGDNDALRVTAPGGNSVDVHVEEIRFNGHSVYLDGRDNAPITRGETLTGTEDQWNSIAASDLIANDIDIDPGDGVGLLSVEGIDIELTRGLSSDYWDASVSHASIGPAAGNGLVDFRLVDFGNGRSGPDIKAVFEDRFIGDGGDNVLFGTREYNDFVYRDLDNDRIRDPCVTEQGFGDRGTIYYKAIDPENADGEDLIRGRGGDDILVGGTGADILRGDGGSDTADYSRSFEAVHVDLASGRGHDGTAEGDRLRDIENVLGSRHDDYLEGDGSANILRGGRGADTLDGNGGADTLIGDGGSDTLDGGAGDDVLDGGSGRDVLSGGAGDDILMGGGGRWDVALFSGEREEYEITAHGDHLVVEHLDGGVDGTDRLYGIQELQFSDHQNDVRIQHAAATHGEVRVTASDIRFRPDENFNSLDGQQGSIHYAVGNDDGARAVETALFDITPVNDAPYLALGTVDYDGKVVVDRYIPVNWPGRSGLDSGSVYYPRVDATGTILGRDVEDGADLTYKLMEDTEHGWVTVNDDGTFRYRLNVGKDSASDPYVEWVRVCKGDGPQGTCNDVPVRKQDPPEDEIASKEARHDSFVVEISDHGEDPGTDDDITIRKRIHIENDLPPDDGGGFFGFPVTLDLNGDGLTFESIADGGRLIDVDADGIKDRVAWAGQGDGMLALDRDGDGRIDATGFREIGFVDDHPDARTDMEGLALAFDTNADGVLDAADERWDEFRVWQDLDGNGVGEGNEVLSLEEAGIESVGVVSDGQAEQLAGGDVHLHGRSEFVRADGTTGVAGDVGLRHEPGEVPESQSPTTDELVAMTVQRIVQSDSIRGAESSPPESSVPVDDAMIATLMSEADEAHMASVAG